MYWHRRLPHWVPDEAVVFVTWRVADDQPRLADRRVAQIVSQAIVHGARVRRYELLAFVVMPDHVHLVIQPAGRLGEIMRWLKTATANRVNRILGRSGAFWRREYYDRWMRSDRELSAAIGYVEDNPVRRGLCACAEEWRWSSAFGPAARPPALP